VEATKLWVSISTNLEVKVLIFLKVSVVQFNLETSLQILRHCSMIGNLCKDKDLSCTCMVSMLTVSEAIP